MVERGTLPASGWASSDGQSGLISQAQPVARDLAEGVWSVLVAGLGLIVGLVVVDKVHLPSVPMLFAALAVAVLALDVVLGPLLRQIASLGSVVLALLLGLSAQLALLAAVLIWAIHDLTLGWRDFVLVLLIAAGFLSLGRWLLGATDTGYVVGSAVSNTVRWRVARRRAALSRKEALTRGLLIVQLDGVSEPVLRRAIEGGQAPNLARWLRSSHQLTGWWATIPSTTPASMAGFLYGDEQQVPAFRWWDRQEGRLLAASRPADSRLVEARLPTGRGLLRDGGTAISTTYTGGADHRYLTLSQADRSRGLGSGATYLSFFARPFLFPSAVVLTVGEMLKELYQARRQKVRRVEPRIARRGSYVALRGITNVLLRKLNLSLTAQEMSAGRPIIFVDFVDYDEIAHHAGPDRPESMRALEGLDAVLESLHDVARCTDREYELIVVSDHGQSLGATFEQLNGRSITNHVAMLMDEASVSRVEHLGGEEWAPINALVASVLDRRGTKPDRMVLGPDRVTTSRRGRARPQAPRPVNTDDIPELAVTGGGNLGMVWFPQRRTRPTLEQIVDRWPRLVAGLIATPGIGLVLVTAGDGSPVVFGATGANALTTGNIDGQDPLMDYPPRAADDLRRLHARPHCGDLVIISTLTEDGQIHAFEHQVGSHGGIGGQQNHAILIHPRDWPVDGELVGPAAVHRQLLAWRRGIGAGPAEGDS